MPDFHVDDEIVRAISRLRQAHEEIETLLDEHDSGDLEDYSSFQVVAENLIEHAVAIADRSDVMIDEEPDEAA